MHFSKYAHEVVMLVRSPLSKSMSQYLIDQIEATNNIRVCTGCVVEEVKGETNLESLVIQNINTGEIQTVNATSLFIFIGAMPQTNWLDGIVERDERGFILAGPDLIRDGKPPKGSNLDRSPFLLETSVPGIFAAGDVRYNSVKRVASGVGEGAIAEQFIHRYLSRM